MTSDDNRRNQRLTLQPHEILSVELAAADGTLCEGRVTDLSMEGARARFAIEGGPDCNLDDVLSIQFASPRMQKGSEISVAIVSREDDGKFLHLGFRFLDSEEINTTLAEEFYSLLNRRRGFRVEPDRGRKIPVSLKFCPPGTVEVNEDSDKVRIAQDAIYLRAHLGDVSTIGAAIVVDASLNDLLRFVESVEVSFALPPSNRTLRFATVIRNRRVTGNSYTYGLEFLPESSHHFSRQLEEVINFLRCRQYEILQGMASPAYLAETASVLMWMSGLDRLRTYFNKRWLDFTGRTLEEEMGMGWTEMVHPDDLEHCLQANETAFENAEPYQVEYRIMRRDRTYRWIIEAAVPRYTPDGQIVGYMGSCIDISDRKEFEVELEKKSRSAEAADQAKSEFLANMTHELRTPMTAILGFAEELLSACNKDNLPEEFQEILQIIESNGQHLLQLINDILDFSKIEAGKLEIAPNDFSLFQLVKDAELLVSTNAKAKGLELKTVYRDALPDMVHTDPLRLKQILINLLGNAIKFTEHGTVSVEVSCILGESSPQLQFDVADTGIGMSESQAEKLFQSFSQADASTSKNYGGTGLGMSISRHLAQLLGGDLVLVRSALGEGSTFRLSLPIGYAKTTPTTGINASPSPTPDSSAISEADLSFDGSPCRILLAEDNIVNRKLLVRILARFGTEIDLAENGEEAVEAALAAIDVGRPFDVVLMDIQMPRVDGYQATRALREAGFKTPILALTANAREEDRRKSLDAGCNDHVAKPVNRLDLLSKIKHYYQVEVERRRQTTEPAQAQKQEGVD